MRVVAAGFTSGRLTMTQLQPLKRSISPPTTPLRIPITGVAELNGFNAVPTHPERLRPLQSAGKLLMHLLLFVIVKAAELATDITSRGSISTNSDFERFEFGNPPLWPLNSRAALVDRPAVFFFPPLVSPSFLHYFAFLFLFQASEFKERNGGFLG